jgi:hypothetical protein
VQGASVGLGGANSSVVLAGVCCSGDIGWLWLDLWDGARGWVLCALSDGGEGLNGWVMGLVLVGGMCVAFVWVETMDKLSGWHRQGCLRA